MGNEKSIPSDLNIQETMNITECWTQKCATLRNSSKICIFEQSLLNQNIHILQHLSKNLMLHRHPYIQKYISCWQANKILYVATEYVEPLNELLSKLIPMQLCIGLYNILKAITFLHEQAYSSHNSLCKDAIFINEDECWKLGSLQFVTKFNKSCQLLDKTFECDINDQKLIDQKGYVKLAEEILNKKTNDEIPAVVEFLEFCKLHSTNPSFFQELYSHPFFSHEFIKLYLFLVELPLKNESDKTEFFKSISEKLLMYPEELVARQLGTLLLSRLVLLNPTAQGHLLMKIFIPRNDQNDSSLFSQATLKKYILPKLLNMFCVHDSQIRLILLQYFSSYCSLFDMIQLEKKILPELLVGIKDTNEILVAATLRTLADLVPVLGASVVIGKGRVKLFADGRPLLNTEKVADISHNTLLSQPNFATTDSHIALVERPSPDGEDTVNSHIINEIHEKPPNCKEIHVIEDIEKIQKLPTKNLNVNDKQYFQKKKLNENLNLLDIKCSISKNKEVGNIDIEEIFKEMEPVISKTAIIRIPDSNGNFANKFKASDADYEDYEGWGNDTNKWVDLEDTNKWTDSEFKN